MCKLPNSKAVTPYSIALHRVRKNDLQVSNFTHGRL